MVSRLLLLRCANVTAPLPPPLPACLAMQRPLLASTIWSSMTSLFGTAAAAGAVGLTPRLSMTLTQRSVMSSLGIPAASLLGGNPALAVASILVTGQKKGGFRRGRGAAGGGEGGGEQIVGGPCVLYDTAGGGSCNTFRFFDQAMFRKEDVSERFFVEVVQSSGGGVRERIPGVGRGWLKFVPCRGGPIIPSPCLRCC